MPGRDAEKSIILAFCFACLHADMPFLLRSTCTHGLGPLPFLQLDLIHAVSDYRSSAKRILILGYNATLTTAVEAPRQPKKHFDQIQALTRVNPGAYACIAALASHPNTEV